MQWFKEMALAGTELENRSCNHTQIMRYLKKNAGFFAAAMSLMFFAACGGNGNGGYGNPTPEPVVSISISPTTEKVTLGNSRTFLVTARNTDFTVSVSPVSGSGCAKSSSNTVTCIPATAGTYSITVTATADQSKNATAQITVEPPPNADNEINIGERPILGSDSAKVIMVQFTNYQCSFCGLYTMETFPAIKEQYIDTGKIRYALVDYPFEVFQHSKKAAQAARCGGDQGKYWEIHDLMMYNQGLLYDLDFFAEALGLDVAEFRSCLDTEKYRDAVQKDTDLAGELLKGEGVPTFFIGIITDPENPQTFQLFSKFSGAKPFGDFKQNLDAAIAAPGFEL
jgi:protein-disulfide isomerase